MFNGASAFNQTMCPWTLEGQAMFDGSLCSVESCIKCSSPSTLPSILPSLSPSSMPSFLPSVVPSSLPSDLPSSLPSSIPSTLPSLIPTSLPSVAPSEDPSVNPSSNPSVVPSSQPSSVPSTQSPCPNSVVLNDNNAKDMLSDYSSDKEAIKCFDTSQVTTMEYPFMKKIVNADISSWDVSSVTAMNVSFRCL